MRRFSAPYTAAVLTGIGGLALLTGCSWSVGDSVHVPFHQTVAATSPVTFSLNNVAGTVRVEAWSKPVVDIQGEKSAPTLAAADDMKIDVEHAAGSIDVTTRYSTGDRQGGVVYTVHLPAGTPLRVINTAGTVRISGMTSDVSAEVSAGTIDVSMDRLTGNQNVNLQTATGTIWLRIPRSSNATISTHQTVGGTRAGVPAVTGNGSATVDLTSAVGSIRTDWTNDR